MIATNIWFWVGFIAFVLAMLALDLGVFNRGRTSSARRRRRSGPPSGSALALLFAGGLPIFDEPAGLR